jgi:hypothetical protein
LEDSPWGNRCSSRKMRSSCRAGEAIYCPGDGELYQQECKAEENPDICAMNLDGPQVPGLVDTLVLGISNDNLLHRYTSAVPQVRTGSSYRKRFRLVARGDQEKAIKLAILLQNCDGPSEIGGS